VIVGRWTLELESRCTRFCLP